MPIVSLKNVSAAYGKAPVLFDVAFDIHAGRTVAVVGESGSGKSTTARCITGLLPPSQGHIEFNGESLAARLSQAQQRSIASGADDLPNGRYCA